MEQKKIDLITEHFSDCEFLQADGFDDAIVGVVFDSMSAVPRLAYSITKCVDVLMNRDGMTPFEAYEFFEFNVQGAYMGEKTPIWVDDTLFN